MARIVHSAESQEFNTNLAEALKKIPEFVIPDWAEFVKSSVAKKRVPEESDFWFKRSASILRQLYIKGVVGVGRLKTRYGSKKDRGMKPDKFRKASGKIIRVILQQAEAVGLVEKIDKTQHGRRLTQHGRDFLDDVANSVIKSENKKEEIKQKLVEEKPQEEEVKEEVKQEIGEEIKQPENEEQEKPVEESKQEEVEESKNG
jgi:small subunit ribosomal protein S19e